MRCEVRGGGGRLSVACGGEDEERGGEVLGFGEGEAVVEGGGSECGSGCLDGWAISWVLMLSLAALVCVLGSGFQECKASTAAVVERSRADSHAG